MKISIITPSYNSEKTIRRTIESVLNQTYNNIEYIIKDGGSTDDTLKIIEEYSDEFIKKGIDYKYVSHLDSGIADAFNQGIALASGEYVGIINSDDWYEKDAVETIVSYIDNKHLVYCGDLNLWNDSIFIKRRKSRLNLLPFGMYVMHPTVFVKRNLYKQNEFDSSLKIAMDYDLMLQIRSINSNCFKYIPSTIANMKLGGVSSDLRKMRYEESLVIERYFSGAYLIIIKLIKKIETIFFC